MKFVLTSYQLWHSHLDHVFAKTVNKVLQLCNTTCSKHFALCDICAIAKMHLLHLYAFDTLYTRPFKLVFMDI